MPTKFKAVASALREVISQKVIKKHPVGPGYDTSPLLMNEAELWREQLAYEGAYDRLAAEDAMRRAQPQSPVPERPKCRDFADFLAPEQMLTWEEDAAMRPKKVYTRPPFLVVKAGKDWKKYRRKKD
jgi:hypothetical protein